MQKPSLEVEKKKSAETIWKALADPRREFPRFSKALVEKFWVSRLIFIAPRFRPDVANISILPLLF
jgi:hypothetical protein